MAALYRNGATLQQIGDRYGVTRERVRQILALNGLAPGL
jgi:DNA-directed RNA polymerase sigma subunit (sigma70/sigma32)